MIIVALDAMGGDHGPAIIVPAALAALKKFPLLKLILVGNKEVLTRELARHPPPSAERIVLRHASEVVASDEPPAQALRGKKDSSLRVAVDLLKSGEAQAMVSAGNTGALMATARFVLKTLAGIDRPAIITMLPAIRGHVHVLDMGANVDCTPEQLLQFAVMGSILVSATEGKQAPKVALLNVGHEDIKGNETVKQAAELLRASHINYCGFAEGDEIYTGDFDVVVCDGFVGNIALKTSEGLAQMIAHFMRQEFKRNIFTTLAGLVAMPVLRAFRNRVDHRRYNGATLIGLNGIVIKSHGSADVVAFEQAILKAVSEVNNQVIARMGRELSGLLGAGKVA